MMKNKKTIFIVAAVLTGGAIIAYFLLKKGSKPTFEPQPGVEPPPSSTGHKENEYDKMLQVMKGHFSNASYFTNGLKIPFFQNFSIQFYNNGRFVFVSQNPTATFARGYWKDYGNVLIFDDGRAFKSKTITKNLEMAKNIILSDPKVFKYTTSWQDFLKKGGSNMSEGFQTAALIKMMSDMGGDVTDQLPLV